MVIINLIVTVRPRCYEHQSTLPAERDFQAASFRRSKITQIFQLILSIDHDILLFHKGMCQLHPNNDVLPIVGETLPSELQKRIGRETFYSDQVNRTEGHATDRFALLITSFHSIYRQPQECSQRSL